jgi:PTS system ascorbate-specific IIA component
MKYLEKNMIALDVEAETPEQAIRAAGDLLVASGAAEPSYVDAMIESYRTKGPYFILAPHIAIPHAKTEDGVHEASVSFVRLRTPVSFGHKTNDPVSLIFALGSATNDEHIALLQKLTLLLNNAGNIETLKTATMNQVATIFQEG